MRTNVVLKIHIALVTVTNAARAIPLLDESVSVVYTTNGTAKVTSPHVVSVVNAIVIMNGGGTINVLMILVEPLLGVEV